MTLQSARPEVILGGKTRGDMLEAYIKYRKLQQRLADLFRQLTYITLDREVSEFV